MSMKRKTTLGRLQLGLSEEAELHLIFRTYEQVIEFDKQLEAVRNELKRIQAAVKPLADRKQRVRIDAHSKAELASIANNSAGRALDHLLEAMVVIEDERKMLVELFAMDLNAEKNLTIH